MSELKPRQQDLLDIINDIQMNPPQEKDKAFLSAQLIQVCLPVSDLGDEQLYQSRNGDMLLTIRSGINEETKENIGLPYGNIPRLIIYWLSNEVNRTRDRKIYIGESVRQFLKDLGLNVSGGGPRSDSARFKEQAQRFFKSSITVSYNGKTKEGRMAKGWASVNITSKGVNFGDGDDYIELSEEFYQMLLQNPVPLDKRALTALKSSSMALDIYCFAVRKCYLLYMDKEKTEQMITWKAFLQQCGTNIKSVKDFKKRAKGTFEKVKRVYPALQIEYVPGGFIIKQAPPAIPMRKEA